MALPATLVSALGFGVPLAAVATGAVLFATAGSGSAPGGGGIPTVWLDSPHEASVLAAGEVPVVVHATAERAPTSLVLIVDGAVVGERQAGPPVLGRFVEAIIPWQASVGPHTLQARAGDLSSPIVPVVVVSPSGSAPTALPTSPGPTATATATALPTVTAPPTSATTTPTSGPPTTRPTSPTTKPSTSSVVPAPVVTSVTLSPTAVDDVVGCDAGAVMGISAKVTGSATSVAFTWVAGTTSGSGTLTSAGAGTWTGSINFGALSEPPDVGPVTITVTARNATGNGTRQAAGSILNCKP